MEPLYSGVYMIIICILVVAFGLFCLVMCLRYGEDMEPLYFNFLISSFVISWYVAIYLLPYIAHSN